MAKVIKKHARRFRYATCCECGRDWNISVLAEIQEKSYLCPACRDKKRKKQANMSK